MATIQDIAELSERSSSPDIGEITQNWSDSDEEGDEADEWEEHYYWHPRRGPHPHTQRNLSLTHASAYPLPLRQFLIRQNVRSALGLPLSEKWKEASSDSNVQAVDLAIDNAASDVQSLPGPIKLAYHEFAMLEDHSPESEQKWLDKDDTMVDYRTWERCAHNNTDIFPKLSYEDFQDKTQRNGRRMYLQREMEANETATFTIRYLASFIQLKPDGKSLDYDYSYLRTMDLNELFVANLRICQYAQQDNHDSEGGEPRWGVAELLFREKWVSKGFRDRFVEEVYSSISEEIDTDELSWARGIGWEEIYEVGSLSRRQIYPGDEGKYVEEEISVVGDEGVVRKKILRRVPLHRSG
ncbi:hypothetical protein BJ508DRAFT_412527 [Ascobolus immersus RN42]|uniref:Uncharacterized protein n=1 Tax=Ascobolus immersus RN42 TaxID=1160509 RepID=A0A3N4IF63_ASCIM|nr:hypothetical protein BJ508DRAFT_412527 [Ascobolus immersus RN42]